MDVNRSNHCGNNDKKDYESKLNSDQREAYEMFLSGVSGFITGAAGTGKSFLIMALVQKLREQGKIVAVTSTTGVSALLVGGRTLHGWGGLGKGEGDAHSLLKKVRKRSKAVRNWRDTSVLIIDEISMLSPDLFTKIEFIARAIRNSIMPFGTIQIILCGDFCQLPPVATDVYCFKSPAWESCVTYVAHLTQNMRQDNAVFQQILNDLRLGKVTQLAEELIEKRVGAEIGYIDEKTGARIIPTKLFSTRKEVDELNKREVNKLVRSGQKMSRYRSKDVVECPEIISQKERDEYIAMVNKNCQAREVLDVCIGAQVMLIYNMDIDAGLVNGSRGVIVRYEELRPVVMFMNGLEVICKANTWEMDLGDGIKVLRTQVPLILAYGLTIHKSQGASLDCAEMDLGDSLFAPGQFYTAISRIRSLEGLSISALDFDKVIVDPEVLQFYAKYTK